MLGRAIDSLESLQFSGPVMLPPKIDGIRLVLKQKKTGRSAHHH